MSTEVQRYKGDQAMFEAAPMRAKDHFPEVHLLWATPDPLGAMSAMCRMYKGIPTYSLANISRDERLDYWEQMHKTHLQAPLEAIKLHFFIEGVDRALTHQMVRQRTAVYAQESLRFAVKENLASETTLPPSLIAVGEASEERALWDAALVEIERVYMALIDRGIPAEDARGLLPHCVKTRIHYITDLRNLIDHAGNRLCTQAQFAWRALFRGIVEQIGVYEGQFNGYGTLWQFEHIGADAWFKPVCYALGHCPFTADFDRQCVIRERVQAGQWNDIHDSEWMLDPTAGRRDG